MFLLACRSWSLSLLSSELSLLALDGEPFSGLYPLPVVARIFGTHFLSLEEPPSLSPEVCLLSLLASVLSLACLLLACHESLVFGIL